MDASLLTTIARAESERGARVLPTHPRRLELQTLRTDSEKTAAEAYGQFIAACNRGGAMYDFRENST